MRHIIFVVTDEHEYSGDGGQDVLQWVQDEKKRKNDIFRRLWRCQTHTRSASGQNCSDNQGIGHFVPELNHFPFFLCETDCTRLTNIGAKGEGVKRPRGFIFAHSIDF